MTHLCSVICSAVLVALVLPAAGQVPDDFVLYQNDPNPFCNMSGAYVTEFRFSCPESAFVKLQVLNPDTSSVAVGLVGETLAAGSHSVLWDGKDSGGVSLPPGDYPYVMNAFVGRPPVFDFADTLTATIECGSTAATELSWGVVKATYGEDEKAPSN